MPQKNNAYVQFNIHLHNNATEKVNGDYGEFVPAQPGDEFLIYSQHLNHITDDEAKPEGVAAFDCRFWPVSENLWTTSGRVHMFKPRDPSNPPSSGEAGNYSIYMRTNTPKSAEVVRIASNTTGENLNPEVPGPYQGRGYRSTSFELANYNPFRFAARIDGEGEDATSDVEEPMTGLEWGLRRSRNERGRHRVRRDQFPRHGQPFGRPVRRGIRNLHRRADAHDRRGSSGRL